MNSTPGKSLQVSIRKSRFDSEIEDHSPGRVGLSPSYISAGRLLMYRLYLVGRLFASSGEPDSGTISP